MRGSGDTGAWGEIPKYLRLAAEEFAGHEIILVNRGCIDKGISKMSLTPLNLKKASIKHGTF